MNINDIEIHVGTPEFSFEAVRQLEAKLEAATNFSSAPTIDEANSKLRSMAAKVGANAVVNVEYKTGMSMTSWRSMRATGLAVVRESEEIACPACAENIKRAAKRCRFCGEALPEKTAPISPRIDEATAVATDRKITPEAIPTAALPNEPLRESNNSTAPYWIATVVLAVLFIAVIIGHS